MEEFAVILEKGEQEKKTGTKNIGRAFSKRYRNNLSFVLRIPSGFPQVRMRHFLISLRSSQQTYFGCAGYTAARQSNIRSNRVRIPIKPLNFPSRLITHALREKRPFSAFSYTDRNLFSRGVHVSFSRSARETYRRSHRPYASISYIG